MCEVDEDCLGTRICDSGFNECTDPICVADGDCTNVGETCVNGRCEQDDGPICDAQTPCAPGFVCEDNQCLPEVQCDTDTQCEQGQVCDTTFGNCVDVGCADLDTMFLPDERDGVLQVGVNNFSPLCSGALNGGGNAPDYTLRLEVEEADNYSISINGIDGYFFIEDSCGSSANVVACGTANLSGSVNLDPGQYYLTIEGVGGGTGNFTVVITQN